MAFVQVAAGEDGEEERIMELPTEIDNTLLLSTLAASFPGACGLKYKTASGRVRGIRNNDGRLHPPGSDGWGSTTYYCVFARVPDLVSQQAAFSLNISAVSTGSSHSILEKYRQKMVQNDSCSSFQSFAERIRNKKDPNSTMASDILINLTKKSHDPKSSVSSSDTDYDSKMKRITDVIMELKKAYKNELMYDFITKSYRDLVLEKPSDLPKHILEHSQTNILKEKVGFFLHPNVLCNRELYQAIFAEPIPSDVNPMRIEDSKVLQSKLFQHVTERAQDALDLISDVTECDFDSFLKPRLVKPGSIFTDEQFHIISQSRKIQNTHMKCKQTASQILATLQQLSHLRTVTLPDLNKEAVHCLQSQADVFERESRRFFVEIEEKIRDSDENMVEALRKLHHHSKEAVDQKSYKLVKLKEQQADYDRVKGKKFSELINEHQHLIINLQSKKEVLSSCIDSSSPMSRKDPHSSFDDRSFIDSDDDFPSPSF